MWLIFELMFAIIILSIIVTQIIVPLWNNTKLFPIFDKNKRKIDTTVTNINDIETITSILKEKTNDK